MEARRLSGCGDRGYYEGSAGELYRGGGVLCRGGSVPEAERKREAGGFADSAGEGGRRVECFLLMEQSRIVANVKGTEEEENHRGKR